MNFDNFENIAGLSLGFLLIGVFTKLLIWFVGELRTQVQTSHTREADAETKSDLLQDKFADEATARARLEVEVEFLKSALKNAQAREIELAKEIAALRVQIADLRRLLDERGKG